MAAYGLSERFMRDSKYYRFYDPGAYQYIEGYKIKPNGAPFLSKVPRKTLSTRPIWTHAIYDSDIPSRIPNCTSMMSKIPRFPYEALSKEDLEEIICKCGFPTTCTCPTEEKKPEPEIVCQGKVPKHIIKGEPPRIGAKQKFKKKNSDESPPFYNARVMESTMYYQGCKWSKWTSIRSTKALELSPGPAAYSIEPKPNAYEICAEKVRSHKRKTSKQYRYIEMVQRKNILDNLPGPSSYSPMLPKGTDLQELGSKADRFSSKDGVHPGPADHNIKRDFDPPEPVTECHAILPEPACFGVKAQRFKPRKEEGPSPATYCPTYRPCHFLVCSKAPFGTETERFKKVPFDENDDMENYCEDKVSAEDPCPHPMWQFKSKTVRIKPLLKCWNEPSPADFLPRRPQPRRQLHVQYLAPFCSSNGRFKPWCNWLSVFGKIVTPGPGYYNLEKPKCYPAVKQGPLYRDRRFREPTFDTPAPNAYNVGGGVETVLNTCNEKLKHNVEKQYKVHGDLIPERKILTEQEKETILLNKCIAICEESINEVTSTPIQDEISNVTTEKDRDKKKLLHFFLYKHQMPICV